MRVRTRFAPSPTGELHLGNARTAVLNWALARRHGGAFVLRFEDTDVERQVGDAEERIREGLAWLGLDPDEGPAVGGPFGPYRQSERLPLYRGRAERLLEEGRAYHCYCTPEELEARREAARRAGDPPGYDGRCRALDPGEEERLRAEGREPSVRFRVGEQKVVFRDRVRGRIAVDPSDFGDFVVLRSDGRPTYNFAVVVDDHLMEITHVVRGVGHLANTPKQLLLYRALGADPPEFAHIPLVLAPGGGGLSKREGSPGLLTYRDRGFHPDAVVNYLSLLAWSSPTGDECLSRERIVSEVDLDRIGSADTEVDPEKMEWLSGRHVAEESPAALARRLEPFLAGAGLQLDARDREALAAVVRGRIRLLTEAVEEASSLFAEPDLAGEAREALRSAGADAVLDSALRELSAIDGWTRDAVSSAIASARGGCAASGAAFYHPLRAALTGRLQGPELPAVAFVLGRERTLVRLREGLSAARARGASDGASEGAADGRDGGS